MKKLMLLTLLAITMIGQTFAQNLKTFPEFQVRISGEGPNLFFIPGLANSGKIWNETVAAYSDRYTCHVFTLAGFAEAPPIAAEQRMPKIKEALTAYIRENSSEDAIVIGHSMGGFYAMWMAAETPELLSKVVVMDAFPFLAGVSQPDIDEAAAETMAAQFEQYYLNMDSLQFRQTQRMTMAGMTKDSTMIETGVAWSEQSDRASVFATMREMMSRDLRQEIAEIKVPTLVLAAYDGPYEQAPFMTRDWLINTFESQYAACKSCQIVVADDARHYIMVDQKDWWLKQLGLFLQQTNP